MRKKTFKSFLLIFSSVMLLASCGGKDGSSSVAPVSSSGTSATTVPTPSSSSIEPGPVVFTDEQLGKFAGVFYSQAGTLLVTGEGAAIGTSEGVVTLQNVSIEGSGFDTKIKYLAANGESFTLSWTIGDKKMPALKGTESGRFVFQPSLQSISGWYTGYGTASQYDIGYYVSNEFDESVGYFDVAMSHYQYGVVAQAAYAKSHFLVLSDGSIALGWDLYYASDIEESSPEASAETYATYNAETGKMTLMYDDEEYDLFTSAPTFFNFSYFDAEDYDTYGVFGDGLFFTLDEEEKTVSKCYDSAVSYSEGFDEDGQYVAVGDEIIRGDGYGIDIEKEGSFASYPVFNFSSWNVILDKNFSKGEVTLSASIDWDTYKIAGSVNEETADSTNFKVVDRVLFLEIVKGEETYLVSLYDGSDAIYVVSGGVGAIYLNQTALAPRFIGNYYTSNLSVFAVSSSLEVSVGGASMQGQIVYDENYGPVLCFAGSYYFLPYSAETGVYAMFDSLDMEETFTVLFSATYIGSFLGTIFTDGYYKFQYAQLATSVYGFVLKAGSLNQMIFTSFSLSVIQSATGDVIPAFVIQNKDFGVAYYVALFPNTYVGVYGVSGNSLALVSSLVPSTKFAGAVGNYYLNGQYGVECVSLSSSGVLTVDTSNEEKTGVEPVVYEASLYVNDDGEVCAQFVYDELPVSVVFAADGAHCSIFTFTYLKEAYFINQGVWTDGTNILVIIENSISYNGEAVTVSSSSVSGTNSIFSGTVGESTISIMVNTAQGAVQLDGGTPIVLSKSAVSLASFAGTYENVSELGYDVAVSADAFGVYHIYWGITGSEKLSEIKSYTFALESGNVVLKFSQAGIDYTGTIGEGGVVTFTGVSNIPPLPPVPSLK